MAKYTKNQVYDAIGATQEDGSRKPNADAETYLLLQEIKDLLAEILAKP